MRWSSWFLISFLKRNYVVVNVDYLRWVVRVIQSRSSETSPDFLLSKAMLFIATFARDSAEVMGKEAPLSCGSECKFCSWKVYLPPRSAVSFSLPR